jgi:hypothetical protein
VYCCVDVLSYCCNVILLLCCVVVLVYCCMDVLSYCCNVVQILGEFCWGKRYELKWLFSTNWKSLQSVCLSRHCLASNERKTGWNYSWHDFASSILMKGISDLCLYSPIQLCTKHMAGFLASSELSPSPEQIDFCGNFLSKLNFSGILFGRLLARIAEYLLHGNPREVKFHTLSWRLAYAISKLPTNEHMS